MLTLNAAERDRIDKLMHEARMLFTDAQATEVKAMYLEGVAVRIALAIAGEHGITNPVYDCGTGAIYSIDDPEYKKLTAAPPTKDLPN